MELNQFIYVEILKKCWHKNVGSFEKPICSCGGWFSNEHSLLNPSYEHDILANRGLWLFMWENKKREDFISFMHKKYIQDDSSRLPFADWLVGIVLDQPRGARSIAEFFGWKEPTK